MNVVAGRPNERLPCFGSQRSSWGTVSFFLLQQWPPKCSRRIQTMALGVRANSCLIIQSCVSFLALESADKYVCEVSHLSVDSDQWPTLNVRTAWDARSKKQERPPWKKIGGCFQSLSEWITRRPQTFPISCAQAVPCPCLAFARRRPEERIKLGLLYPQEFKVTWICHFHYILSKY